MAIAVKYVLSGNVIERYWYERVILGKGGCLRTGQVEGANKEKNYAQTNSRRREFVRRLALSNFSRDDLFVTLTFADNVTDVGEANAAFKLFMQRLRYRYGDFRYLAVVEFQGRGAVHYHMLLSLKYIDHSELSQIWGQGFVWLKSISHVDNVGAYLVKYMVKDSSDRRLMGQKGYLCSQGLNRWAVISDWDCSRRDREKRHPYLKSARRALLAQLGASLCETEHVYSRMYHSDYTGTCVYTEFNLDRCPGGSDKVLAILKRLSGKGIEQPKKCSQLGSKLIKKAKNRVELTSPLRC